MRRNSRSLVLSAAVIATALALAAPAAAARPDPWITTKAKIALLSDPDVHGLQINVDTVDGRVTLHGDVATGEEKAEAERVVRSIEGVTDVRNMLKIEASKTPAAGNQAKADTDDAIAQRVKDAIDKDAALDDADIKVASVDNGVVTLDGKARTMSEHRRALERTRAVSGVKAVKSNVEAPADLTNDEVWADTKRATKDTAAGAGSAAKDMWITSATKVRLMANDKTPAMDINVDTRDGEVALFGMVPTEDAKKAAEMEARKVNGVVAVRNELQVVAPKAQEAVEAKDDALKEAVDKKIDARAELEDVDVEVTNGVAKLTGTVGTQSDRLGALTTARSVPGIRSAIDELKVSTSDGDAAAIEKRDRLEDNRDTDAFDADAQNDAGDAPLR